MAYARSFIEPADMLSILSMKTLSGDEEKLLKDHLIPAVCNEVETYCQRQLLSLVDLTQYYTGKGMVELVLRESPIISVTSVKEKVSADYASGSYTYDLTENTHYVVENDTGILRRCDGGVWSSLYRYYQVIYTAGYTKANLPADLLMGVKKWIAILFQKTQTKLHGVSTHMFGDEVMTYVMDGIPDEVKIFIDPYRRLYG